MCQLVKIEREALLFLYPKDIIYTRNQQVVRLGQLCYN